MKAPDIIAAAGAKTTPITGLRQAVRVPPAMLDWSRPTQVMFLGPGSIWPFDPSDPKSAMREHNPAVAHAGAEHSSPMTKKISVSACPDRDYVYVGGGVAERLTSEEALALAGELCQEADALDGRTSVPAVWRSDDPRTAIDSRGAAVVIWTGNSTIIGIVRTQGVSRIELPLRHITEGEAWPEGWLWTLAPAVKL